MVHRYRRLKWYWATEKRLYNGGAYRPGTPTHTVAEQAARGYIAKMFADRPDLEAAVTPNYPFWGKRTIFSSDFYPALKQPNVELVPRTVASITARGVVDVDGVEHDADVLVLSTGFQPTNYLAHLEVVGRTGDTLQKYWDGEPRAFLGVTVPTFPNFFMLYGPGTNGGEIALNLRNQAAYTLRVVKRMVREGVTAVEVKRSWADPYHAWLMAQMESTAWAVSNNYFTTKTGKIVTQWPFERARLRRAPQDPRAPFGDHETTRRSRGGRHQRRRHRAGAPRRRSRGAIAVSALVARRSTGFEPAVSSTTQRRITQPPSTLMVWPLIQSPALEQSSNSVPTRSSGGPDFLPGIPASIADRMGESFARLT